MGLTNGAPNILDHFSDNNFFKRELLQCIVEITTDVCNNIDEIYDDLRPKLNMAIEYANNNGIELLSMPIHPFSKVSDQKVSNDKRYTDFLDRMQWPLRRLLITGIHVHVGVESGEKAIAIINGMKRYIPYLIALLQFLSFPCQKNLLPISSHLDSTLRIDHRPNLFCFWTT